jgi:hypothetical protein
MNNFNVSSLIPLLGGVPRRAGWSEQSNLSKKRGATSMFITLNKYFTIGTDEWRVTVKYCLKYGAIVGLVVGASLIIRGVI